MRWRTWFCIEVPAYTLPALMSHAWNTNSIVAGCPTRRSSGDGGEAPAALQRSTTVMCWEARTEREKMADFDGGFARRGERWPEVCDGGVKGGDDALVNKLQKV